MLSLVSGILFPLLFPKFNLFFLFPVAMVPVTVFSLKSAGIKKVFYLSWISGTLSALIMLYWIYPTLIKNDAGFLTALLALFALSAYMGIYWAVWASGVHYMRRRGLKPLILLIPALWTVLEYVRTYLISGFPWLLAGNSLWPAVPLIQIASITGIYGLSFLVLLVNAGVSLSIVKKRIAPALYSIAVLLAVIIYGAGAAGRIESSGGDIRISVLQGNISQYKKWNAHYRNEILVTYGRLIKEARAYRPELMVWPETALPGALTSEPEIYIYMEDIAARTGAYQLVGSVEQIRDRYYNSAYLVSPEGEVSEPYRKNHLTPFGEYIPVRFLLAPFIRVVNEIGDFDAGGSGVILPAGGTGIGIGICFEEIFPGLVRKAFQNGADIFVNITNDGWFLKTAGPYQHFIHAVIRAVENRSFVVRSANTGISAIIDPAGRVIAKTGVMEQAVLNGTVGARRRKSFYTRYGDLFTLACFVIIIYVLAVKRFKKEQHKNV